MAAASLNVSQTSFRSAGLQLFVSRRCSDPNPIQVNGSVLEAILPLTHLAHCGLAEKQKTHKKNLSVSISVLLPGQNPGGRVSKPSLTPAVELWDLGRCEQLCDALRPSRAARTNAGKGVTLVGALTFICWKYLN